MTVPIPDPDFKLQQGGVVLVSPAIYSVFLGNSWNTDPDHSARMVSLKQFLNDLPDSGFMNVLSQYGCGFGARDAGCSIQSFIIPNDALTNDQELQDLLQQMIDLKTDTNPLGGMIPNPGTPATICVLVFLANNTRIGFVGVADSNEYAYHSHFTTTKGDLLSYGLIGPGNLNQIPNFISKQLDAQTVLCSHEYAEMVTNPSNQGWIDKVHLGENGKAQEVADLAQTPSNEFPNDTIVIGNHVRSWQVHEIYSVADGGFVVSAPSPLPKLSMAPIPRRLHPARIHQLAKVSKLLPLPNLRHDMEQNRFVRNEDDTRAFLERLFHPYRPSELVSDLPGLLRHLADVIEKDDKYRPN